MNPRRSLEYTRRELQERLARIGRPVIEKQPDLCDAVVEFHARERQILDRQHCQHYLAEVEAALRRLEDGTYGCCLGCERLIPRRRLELVPWAAYCVPCTQNEMPHAA